MTPPSLAEDVDTALYEADPVERDRARGRVARQADDATLRLLVAALDAAHRQTRRRAARILSEARPDRVRPHLAATLRDRALSARVRAAAARLLGILAAGDEPALADGLADPEASVRRHAASARAPEAALVTALLDPDPGVATHAAQALAERGASPPADVLAEAVAHHDPAPEGLLRALAAAAPASPAVVAAAQAGVDAALDHLADPATLRALLATEHRVVAAWHLARLGEATAALAADPDPRVRAAAARGLLPDDPALAALAADADPAVRWTAARALAGDFARPEERLAPHARANAPSARPPYGLSPDDAVAPVPRLHAALALCHTRIDVNLGVAVRSAEAAGLEAVFLVGRGDLFSTPARGTDRVIPVHAVADAAALVRTARERGYQIVGLQQTPRSVPYHRAPYPPSPLFVVGAEDTGLPAALRSAADLLVEIPMYGVIDSLNVAASATCVMFHWRVHRA